MSAPQSCYHCMQDVRGSAHVNVAGCQYPVCHPPEGDGMDCYRLVTVYHHLLLGGCPCLDTGEH